MPPPPWFCTMSPRVLAIATCCSSLICRPRKKTTPRCSRVARIFSASLPLSSVSTSVLISPPIAGVQSTISSCCDESPIASAQSRQDGVRRMLYPRLLPQLDRQRHRDQRVEQIAQVGDVLRQRFGVVEFVDVGDRFLGVREQLVVERLDLGHGTVHALQITLGALHDCPLSRERLDL